MNRVKGLTPKQAYEFAKGTREITPSGSKKLKHAKVTREFLEKNQKFFLKNFKATALVGASLSLIENGDSPVLPEALHNKMLALRVFPDTKSWKRNYETRRAEEYFEIIKHYESNKELPHRYTRRYSRNPYKARILINELSEEEMEVLLENPYYALKYAKNSKRFPEKIENKLLNDSPVEYAQRKYRSKKRSGKTPAEWAYYMRATSEVLLDYCNKFGVGLPASVHNQILFRSANGEQYNNGQIHEGFDWKRTLSWEERRKIGFNCKYKRHIKNYNDFISYLPTLIAKKKLDCTNKISDLLKKRMSKKDRMYLETFVNVQMLNKEDQIATMFSAKVAA